MGKGSVLLFIFVEGLSPKVQIDATPISAAVQSSNVLSVPHFILTVDLHDIIILT